jgi:hypothetical protein
MIDLPDVTIFSMVWSNDARWIARVGKVLRYCLSIMRPCKAILFTHNRIIDRGYPFEVVQIPELNWQSYNIFLNSAIPHYIHSQFAMSVHEDGFPIDVSQWDSEFLKYDYIGAPWFDYVVGNGGFNIESKKLMDLKCSIPMTDEDFRLPSDRYVCSAKRQWLENNGVKFAPVPLALKFSTEQIGGGSPSFGFHGRLVSAAKYNKGWDMINVMAAKATRDGFLKVGNKIVPMRRGFPPSLSKIWGTPRIELVYVHVKSPHYMALSKRFVQSYKANPPGYEHSTTIVCNGGPLDEEIKDLFKEMPGLKFFVHDNSGWDIGAYLVLSKSIDCDLMFCLASSGYVKKPGWLKRIADAYLKFGPGLYGTLASHEIRPHFCTTGFGVSPEILRRQTLRRGSPNPRYEFEHGPNWMVGYCIRKNIPVKLVTWDGEYDWRDWRRPENVYAKGDQSNCLTFFKHSDSYEASDPVEKSRRTQIARSNPRL